MQNFLIRNEKLLKALSFAQLIAKQTGGRVATLPDLAEMRTKHDQDTEPWNCWAIPATTLYIGTYKEKQLIVVAHHFGPLTTEERLMTWEKSGEKDEGSDREKYGLAGCPKITQDEFNNLVEGKYGPVKIIDFYIYYLHYQKHLDGTQINVDAAAQDQLLESLLSTDLATYKTFLGKCFEISKKYAEEQRKQEGAAEKILELSIEDRYGWDIWNSFDESIVFPEQPIAFMLLFQRPSFWSNHDLSVSTEIHVHESLGYSQFIVLNDANEEIIALDFDPAKHWKQCLVDFDGEFTDPFFSLVGKDTENLFVEYPKLKDGGRMDTGEWMFPVKEITAIGKPTTFTTHDCLFFLKYHVDEVQKLAPKGANAYAIIGDVEGKDTVKVPIQFYHVIPNTAQRILRSEEVMNNLNLLLEINNVLMPA